MGRRESVKFAEENRVSAERGGRPCLHFGCSVKVLRKVIGVYTN